MNPLLTKLLDKLLPTACAGCRASGTVFCAACFGNLKWIQEPICQLCGNFVRRQGKLCYRCYTTPPPLKRIRGAVWFQGSVQNAIRQLKYSNKFGIAPALADIMVHAWSQWQMPVDLVVPIPLHELRLQERGYNQAELLARHFADSVGLICETGGLFRPKATRKQVGLSMAARLTNVRDAFQAAPSRIKGRNILLIDDVATTGATMAASAETLLKNGAEDVWGFCLARAAKVTKQS